MVGLEAAASNYFIFIALLFVFSIVMNQQISIFTAICPTKGGVQAASSCLRWDSPKNGLLSYRHSFSALYSLE
jgi:hypothetical protein